MGVIQKYIVSEVTKVFLVAITVATLIMTLGVGVNEAIRHGLPVRVACGVIPYLIPETLRITVPASLLFSICTVFGRMSANGEVTSVKAMGIHPFRLFKPVLWLAYVMSIGTFVMYEVSAGWARPNLKQTLVRAVDEMAYSTLRAERVLSAKGVTLAVKDVHGRQLINPRLKIHGRDGNITLAQATTATLEEVDTTGVLRVYCNDVSFNRQDYLGSMPGSMHYDIPFKDPLSMDPGGFSPAELRSNLLDDQVELEQSRLASLKAQAALADSGSHVQEKLKRSKRRLHRLEAEAARRMSNGFAVLAFALIGIPVATWSKSQDNMNVFFLCIAPIGMLYYPLMVVGEELARTGFWPVYSVWIAPVTLTLIGLLLIRNFNRY